MSHTFVDAGNQFWALISGFEWSYRYYWGRQNCVLEATECWDSSILPGDRYHTCVPHPHLYSARDALHHNDMISGSVGVADCTLVVSEYSQDFFAYV
jgi:hypothetical protein